MYKEENNKFAHRKENEEDKTCFHVYLFTITQEFKYLKSNGQADSQIF